MSTELTGQPMAAKTMGGFKPLLADEGGNIQVSDAPYQSITEVSGGITYIGKASLWVGTDAPLWSIKQIEVIAGVTTVKYPVWVSKYPSDKAEFTWDERATLNFSFTPDSTAPILTTVTIESDNSDTTLAKVGDEITLTIISNEDMKDVVVTIAWHGATEVKGIDNKHYTATYTMISGDTAGDIPFTINFKDFAGNSAIQIVATTDNSSVTFDKTAPTMASATRDSNTQITVTLSELALASSITKANDGGFIVYDGASPLTTYAISAIAPGATDDLVVLTCADTTASAANWLLIAYAHVWNGTVSDLAGNLLATDVTGIEIAAW